MSDTHTAAPQPVPMDPATTANNKDKTLNQPRTSTRYFNTVLHIFNAPDEGPLIAMTPQEVN